MTPPLRIDLNCDIGEHDDDASMRRDEALAAIVTSMNIACGGHAGTPRTMRRMLEAAKQHGAAAGAHPSYPDVAGFGRTELDIESADLARSIREQCVALAKIASEVGVRITHVKPHGALYHAAMTRREVAEAVAAGARAISPRPALVGFAGAPALVWWREMGFVVLSEAFADRVYEPDGSLRSRKLAGAMIVRAADAAEQAVLLARGGQLVGVATVIACDTICIHSDSPGAVDTARAVRARLASAGFKLVPPDTDR